MQGTKRTVWRGSSRSPPGDGLGSGPPRLLRDITRRFSDVDTIPAAGRPCNYSGVRRRNAYQRFGICVAAACRSVATGCNVAPRLNLVVNEMLRSVDVFGYAQQQRHNLATVLELHPYALALKFAC